MRQRAAGRKDQQQLRLMASDGLGLHCGCIEDLNLSQIVDAWPTLPEGMKQAIMAIVDAAQPKKKAV